MDREAVYSEFVDYISTGENYKSFCTEETTLLEQMLDQFMLPRSTRTAHIHSARSDNLQTMRQYILHDAFDENVEVLHTLITQLKEIKARKG